MISAVRFGPIIISLCTMVFGGCIYSRATSFPVSESKYEKKRFSSAKWDSAKNEWWQDFKIKSVYVRTGIYDVDAELVPGRSFLRWGYPGLIIWCIVRLPTQPIEAALYKRITTMYDGVFIDRNSGPDGAERIDLPSYKWYEDAFMRPEYEQYVTNEVIIAHQNYNEGRNEGRLSHLFPVLKWKDASGNVLLLALQNIILSDDLTKPLRTKLLLFKNFGFVRGYEFGEFKYGYHYYHELPEELEFSTYDGRYVNVGSFNRNIPWMFRQIDLETGADIKVGHYDDIPVGGSSGGIEVRVTKCEPEQEGEFVYDKLHYVTFYWTKEN